MAQVSATTELQIAELAAALQRIFIRLFAALRLCDTSSDDSSSRSLTTAQLSILLTLLNRGPLRVTELARLERVQTPTATVAIRRLEKLGLVERSRDGSDLRVVLVRITPRGLADYKMARDARRAHLAALLAKLTVDELNVLAKALAPLECLGDGYS